MVTDGWVSVVAVVDGDGVDMISERRKKRFFTTGAEDVLGSIVIEKSSFASLRFVIVRLLSCK